MMTCPNKPECPYRVVIPAYAIDEIRFAESPEQAAVAVAEDHDLDDALLEAVSAVVAEVPSGERLRYTIRAYPVVMFEVEAEADADAERCRLCDAETCNDEAHGRRGSIERDSLAAPGRPGPDSADGCP